MKSDPFFIVVNGQKVFANNAEDAVALAIAASGQAAPKKRGRPPNPKLQPNAELKERGQTALKFLKAIQDAGAHGADSEKIMKVLETSGSKGIGGKSAVINRILEDMGFSPPEVYDNTRNPNEPRMWKPGPKIPDAIKLIQRKYG